MKLTKNMIRNVCAFFLTLRDQAQAEGLTQAAANADKGYRNYQELLYQADGKRPPGVGAGQPSLSWKITIKTRLPLIKGDGNATEEISPDSLGETAQAASAAAVPVSPAGGLY
ncbi:hypothetical protein [Paenibacillus sp. DMB5]|uniref:hypothetical protein n=1 Tax=Paenibacillus sp. DMB5 TaxID=1780103 RepID=UPI00076C9C82|nr:hypothetical protein [Paenibacillus sp. DMB5]KUP24894.1 hypothetical protein AWJ19_03130 [Paenibacillus sp. DMB5]